MPDRTASANTFGFTLEASTSKGKLKTKGESKEVVGENKGRIGLWLSPGTKDVWVSLGSAAVVGEGIVLREKGAPVYISGYGGKVFAIASAEEPEIGIAEI